MAEPLSSETIVGTLVGAVFGFLSSVAVFRARFTAIEKDVQRLGEKFELELKAFQQNAKAEWERIRDDVHKNCGNDESYRRRSERREMAMLEVLTSIARTMKVQSRFTDPGSYDSDTPDDRREHDR